MRLIFMLARERVMVLVAIMVMITVMDILSISLFLTTSHHTSITIIITICIAGAGNAMEMAGNPDSGWSRRRRSLRHSGSPMDSRGAPTPARVAAMLRAHGYDADDVVCNLAPMLQPACWRDIAINAVMAAACRTACRWWARRSKPWRPRSST
jgi:hypothetical protein